MKAQKMNGKVKILLVSLVLLLSVTVGGTLAYLWAQSSTVTNEFSPSKVTTSIEETLMKDVTTDDLLKTNVKIKNTGDTEAWIRAAVIVTWQDEHGNVYGQLPVEGADKDYTMTIKTSLQEETPDHAAGRWVQASDGFYYWTTPVLSENENATKCFTGVLIESATTSQTVTVDGVTYYLNIEIIGSGIQSVPDNAVTSSWSNGVETVEGTGKDRTLVIKPVQGGAGQ